MGSLTGEWLSVKQKLSDANSFLWGHQGYEYVDLGRGWQILLFAGLFTGYAVYRFQFPLAFAESSRHLEIWAGTLNTRSDVQFPCYRLWLTFTVLWDGRVSLCCADFDGRTILGDLNTSTIKEVWNSEPFRHVRRQHLESGGPDICRACDLPRKDSPLWITKLS